jgi:hypothetical protein
MRRVKRGVVRGARLLVFALASRAALRGPRYFSHNGGGGGGRARRGKNLLLALVR